MKITAPLAAAGAVGGFGTVFLGVLSAKEVHDKLHEEDGKAPEKDANGSSGGAADAGFGADGGCGAIGPDKVLRITDTSIPAGAYQACEALEEVDAPQATVIGANAFASCYNLKTVNAPLVTKIEEAAFAQDYNLVSFTGSAVTSIGSSAFFNNYNFKDWSVFDSAQKGTNWNYHKDVASGNDCPTTQVVELTDTVIKANTYVGCVKIENLNLPNAETIEDGAFYFNPNIKTVTAPKLKSVGDQAFFAGYNMETFSAPDGVQQSGSYAFYNTYNLKPARGLTVGKEDQNLK
jgi:hypothetical protein